MGPEALAQVLRPLKLHAAPPELLVGLRSIDDAAVYRLNEQQAVISTADFFPPVVDDPYAFGAIAAANAMSDVYAMGGQVLMAINLVAWPDNLDPGILSEVLQGGVDIVTQAGAVTGIVHPDHILTKGGAQPGDYLLLGKPLGTGLITTAHKREQIEANDLQAALQSMMQLNRSASQALQRPGVHAVTDITGFGLLGHAWEMAAQSLTSMRFRFDALPLLPQVRHYAELGCITGGAHRNQEYFSPHVHIDERLDVFDRELLWDPQTSGGLFAAVDPRIWPEIAALAPGVQFWHIGEVTERVEEEAKVVLEVY
jgi:selenide, water dikinase